MLTPEEEIELAALEEELGPQPEQAEVQEAEYTGLTPEEEQELAELDAELGYAEVSPAPKEPEIKREELTRPFVNSKAFEMFDQAIAEEESYLADQETKSLIETLGKKLGSNTVLGGLISRTLSREQNKAASIDEKFQIQFDEGTEMSGGSHVSYKDSVGKLTGGIGHLLTEEEKKKYPIGTPIPSNVVNAWFEEDLNEAKEDADKYLKGIVVPEEVKNIIINMAFNLGYPKLIGFDELRKALKKGDYNKAADEMVDSKWYSQVGDRSKRLVARMRALSNGG